MKKENTYRINYNSISNYYNELESDSIMELESLCKSREDIKNFLDKTINYNIYLFKKKNKKWNIKSEKQIINDCKSKKKTLLRKHADKIVNLSKTEQYDTIEKLELETKHLSNHIENIDSILNSLESESNDEYENIKSIFDEKYKFKIIDLNLDYIAEYGN